MSNVRRPRKPAAPSRADSNRILADLAAGNLTPAPGDTGAAAIAAAAQLLAPPASPSSSSSSSSSSSIRPAFALDPASTRVIVFTHGSYPCNAIAVEIPLWLHANGLMGSLIALSGSPVERIRNEAMLTQVIQAPPRYRDFIFCDSDQRPNAHTDIFLRVPGDIVVCECPVPQMGAWADPQAFHCGLFRVKRHVIETIKPPWFAFETTPDGARQTNCECGYFAAKAKAAGFLIVRAGWCDHFKTFAEKH